MAQINRVRQDASGLIFSSLFLLFLSGVLGGFAPTICAFAKQYPFRVDLTDPDALFLMAPIGIHRIWVTALFGLILYFASFGLAFRFWRYCPENQLWLARILLIFGLFFGIGSMVWGFTGYVLSPIEVG